MDPILGGLLAGGANILGSLFGSSKNNANALALQQQQQDFSERMSSTAYQRASADMKSAGLNPMMMFSSGSAASTPVAPPAQQLQSPGKDIGSSIEKAISTATAMKTANATIDNLVEQNAKIKAETLTETARPQNVKMDTALKDIQGYNVEAERDNRKAGLRVILNDALRSDNEAEFRKTPAGKVLDQAGMAGRKASDVISPVTNLISSARGVRSLFSDRYGSWN